MPAVRSSQGSDDPTAVVQMPADLVERLVAAMERIAVGQTAEAAADIRSVWLSEINASNTRWQAEALTTIAERLNNLSRPAPRPTGLEPSLEQRQLVLRYDAYRTALGRPGAAAIIMGVRSRNIITVTVGNVPDGHLKLVVYDPTGKEIGYGFVSRNGTGIHQAQIDSLQHDDIIGRFELWDEADIPIRFGVMVPNPSGTN